MAKQQIAITFIIVQLLLNYALAGVINLTTDNKSDADFAVGKCRQRCFIKTMDRFSFRYNINSAESIETCRQKPDCYMCYDYCRVLTVAAPDLASAMCSDEVFCTKGCQIACKFHRIKVFQTLVYELINSS